MYARLQTFHQPAEKLDELSMLVQEQATPRPPGSKGLYYLIDRDNGKAILLTLWESQEDLRQLEASNASTRAQVKAESGVESPGAEVFEVVLQSS